tara:strand:- start:1714 stop:2238 length:525 start_codon:yes stop_codon:yes gene_type:complete
MGVRSLGNDPSSFKYKFGRTGLKAASQFSNLLTTEQLRTKGTAIGNMTQDGGLSSAFDDSTTGDYTQGARKDPSQNAVIGRNFGEDVTIAKIILFRPDGDGSSGSNCFPGSGGGTYTIQRSDNGSSYTDVTSVSGTTDKSITITFTAASAQYWRVSFGGDIHGGTVQEMQFYSS